MEIIKELNRLISKQQELLEIAEVQLINGYSKGWYKEKKTCEGKIKFFKKLLYLAKIDEDPNKTAGVKVTRLNFKNENSPKLCYTNYRVMLLLNKKTDRIDAFFWTPELCKDNSHRALWNYAMWEYLDTNVYDPDYRWGGFYTYGLGNGNQKQLTLYGESSDYRHNEHSEDIKECYLKGMRFSEYMKTKVKQ